MRSISPSPSQFPGRLTEVQHYPVPLYLGSASSWVPSHDTTVNAVCGVPLRLREVHDYGSVANCVGCQISSSRAVVEPPSRLRQKGSS
eukprot:6140260-Pyramimonas_sp.AAC.1